MAATPPVAVVSYLKSGTHMAVMVMVAVAVAVAVAVTTVTAIKSANGMALETLSKSHPRRHQVVAYVLHNSGDAAVALSSRKPSMSICVDTSMSICVDTVQNSLLANYNG
jgi:hypothetical protein